MNYIALLLVTIIYFAPYVLSQLSLKRNILRPFRTKALLTYCQILPSWTHHYWKILEIESSQLGTYLRLRSYETLIILGPAIFTRLMLGFGIPSQKIILIVLSAAAFMTWQQIESRIFSRRLEKISILLNKKIFQKVVKLSLETLDKSTRIQSESATSIIQASSEITGITKNIQSMTILLGDSLSFLIISLLFIVIAGFQYISLLFIFVIYIFSEMLIAKYEVSSYAETKKPSSMIYSAYSQDKEEWERNNMQKNVLHDLKHSLLEKENKKAEKLKIQSISDIQSKSANAIVMVVLTITSLYYFISDLGSGYEGRLLAGLLIIFRLISISKSASRNYYYCKLTDQNRTNNLVPNLSTISNSITHEHLNKNWEGLDKTKNIAMAGLKIENTNILFRAKELQSNNLVLRNINLNISSNTISGIYCRRGQGGDTLAYSLGSVNKPEQGRIIWKGLDIRHHNANFKQNGIFIITDSILNYAPSSKFHKAIEKMIYHNLVYEDDSKLSNPIQVWQEIVLSKILEAQESLIVFTKPELWGNLYFKDLLKGNFLNKIKSNNTIIIISSDKNYFDLCEDIYVLHRSALKKTSLKLDKKSSISNKTA